MANPFLAGAEYGANVQRAATQTASNMIGRMAEIQQANEQASYRERLFNQQLKQWDLQEKVLQRDLSAKEFDLNQRSMEADQEIMAMPILASYQQRLNSQNFLLDPNIPEPPANLPPVLFAKAMNLYNMAKGSYNYAQAVQLQTTAQTMRLEDQKNRAALYRELMKMRIDPGDIQTDQSGLPVYPSISEMTQKAAEAGVDAKTIVPEGMRVKQLTFGVGETPRVTYERVPEPKIEWTEDEIKEQANKEAKAAKDTSNELDYGTIFVERYNFYKDLYGPAKITPGLNVYAPFKKVSGNQVNQPSAQGEQQVNPVVSEYFKQKMANSISQEPITNRSGW